MHSFQPSGSLENIPLIPGSPETATAVEQAEVWRFTPRRQPRCSAAHLVLASAILISVISLCWNAFTLFSVSSFTSGTGHDIGVLTMATTSRALRHPSLYPGIQRVTEIKAIMHVESFVAQAKASAHATDEAGATPPSVQPIPSSALRPTAVGRVNALRPYQQYPQDGWVLLTEQDHAIMEFRPTHPDSTNCMLKGTFPMRHALEHKLLTIEVDDPAQDAPLIQASVLSGSTISEFSHITWITRPNVRDDLGTLDAAFGVDWQTRSFACTPGERVLVELACVGSGCRIEYNWLEESALPRFGIELAQVQ